MKTKILLLLIITILGISSCQKLDIEEGTPECIQNLIKDFDKEQTCNNEVNVKKYTFQGETVYVFNPGNCSADLTSEVIDSDCYSIGFLGGISGNTKINGGDFSNSIFESAVWER